MRCSKCNNELQDGTKFCDKCHASVESNTCPNCGSKNTGKFCGQCGINIEEYQSTTHQNSHSNIDSSKKNSDPTLKETSEAIKEYKTDPKAPFPLILLLAAFITVFVAVFFVVFFILLNNYSIGGSSYKNTDTVITDESLASNHNDNIIEMPISTSHTNTWINQSTNSTYYFEIEDNGDYVLTHIVPNNPSDTEVYYGSITAYTDSTMDLSSNSKTPITGVLGQNSITLYIDKEEVICKPNENTTGVISGNWEDTVNEDVYSIESMENIKSGPIENDTAVLEHSLGPIEIVDNETFKIGNDYLNYRFLDTDNLLVYQNDFATILCPYTGETLDDTPHITYSADDYILPNSDSTYISEEDIVDLSPLELRLAKNEIYARHGLIFDNDDLNSYFNNKPWYNGNIKNNEFTNDMLNSYEIANLEILQTQENNLNN